MTDHQEAKLDRVAEALSAAAVELRTAGLLLHDHERRLRDTEQSITRIKAAVGALSAASAALTTWWHR